MKSPLLHDILVRSFQCDVGPCVVPSRTEVALQLRERLSEYFNTPEEFAGVEPRSSHAELADLERCQTVRGTLAV